MSTHGCFATPFPPSFFFPVDATRWWIPGARCHRRWILLRGDRRRLGLVRRSQAGGLASSIIVAFVLAFLRHPCLTYVCTQILLLPLTLVYRAFVFEPSRPLACNIKLVSNLFVFRVVLWYLPVSTWSWLYTFACMISVRLNQGRHNTEGTLCVPPNVTM